MSPRAIHVLDWGAGPGQGVSRLARRLAGRSIGVVLSSGGARGFAHIGVLEELIAAGLTIDRVGGCSMGAFVGAMFARGLTPAEIRIQCHEELVLRRPLSDYTLPTTSLVRGRRAHSMLTRTLGPSTAIEELVREFFCVSCDLVSGQQVVHRRGSLLEAVGASMCLPGVFAPIPRDGALLVDGGLLDSLPVGTMAAAAEGPIIAVDVGRQFEPPGSRPPRRGQAIARLTRRSRPDVVGTATPLPALKETLARSMVLGSIDAAEVARARADLVIEPDTGTCGMLEFQRLDEMVEIGRRAARDALSRESSLVVT